MNILLLTREYKHSSLPNCGGTGSFMASFAKELVKKQHTVYVIGINKSNSTFNDEGVFVHYYKNLFRRNPIINFFRSLTKKATFLRLFHFKIHEYEKKDVAKIVAQFLKKKQINFDIIETHDFEGLYLYLDQSIPIVVRCHGSFSVLEKYFNYKGVEFGKKHCEELAFKKAKNVVSISEFSEVVNRDLFGITNFKRIYNGIDTSIFKIVENEKIIPKSIFYFGTVAMEKGADTAIQILLKMLETESETSLHFIGIENNTFKIELLKIIEEHKIKDKVHFYGFQKTENLIPLLSKAEVVIFPSKGETFGLALCETMSLSKPVIASNIPSFNEIIISGENGFIASTIQEYCGYIESLFNSKSLSDGIKNKARNTVINRFSQEKMIEETLVYYKELIKENQA
jgi:glycosyltransferase involved in cell wall biosynthesis